MDQNQDNESGQVATPIQNELSIKLRILASGLLLLLSLAINASVNAISHLNLWELGETNGADAIGLLFKIFQWILWLFIVATIPISIILPFLRKNIDTKRKLCYLLIIGSIFLIFLGFAHYFLNHCWRSGGCSII